MKTIILFLISFFSFSQPKTENIWIGGKSYQIQYDDKKHLLTLSDFKIKCKLIEDDFLSDDGSDIFRDNSGNYFHLAWTDFGLAIIPLEKCYVEWKSVHQ